MTAIYSHDKREIGTPMYGTFRAGADKHNPLLAKDSLGNVRPTCYDLPSAPTKLGIQHEYGLEQFRTGEGAAEVVADWATNDASVTAMPGKDFKMSNKYAVIHGAVSSAQFAKIRQEGPEFRLKTGMHTTVQAKPYDSLTTFGRKSEPPINMSNLMNHSYRYEWTDKHQDMKVDGKVKARKKPSDTKSSALMAQSAAAKREAYEKQFAPDAVYEKPKVWVPKAFANVPCKVTQTG
jgi:hypothetical protein